MTSTPVDTVTTGPVEGSVKHVEGNVKHVEGNVKHAAYSKKNEFSILADAKIENSFI